MPVAFELELNDEPATERLGVLLARVLPPGMVVALDGTLGAGKTRLVQAVAAAAGADRKQVTSPTFTLIHEYASQPPICHFDAYRIKDDDEFRELGVDEYFGRPGWCFVEWAGRVRDCLPAERLEIRLEERGPQARRAIVTGHGRQGEAAARDLQQAWRP
jgi:tRNA threonylcarbamoyladenosine biosynthesis protein TsaE